MGYRPFHNANSLYFSWHDSERYSENMLPGIGYSCLLLNLDYYSNEHLLGISTEFLTSPG